jgi:hypothetical protein
LQKLTLRDTERQPTKTVDYSRHVVISWQWRKATFAPSRMDTDKKLANNHKLIAFQESPVRAKRLFSESPMDKRRQAAPQRMRK